MLHAIRIHNNSIQMTDLLKCLMPLEDYENITPSRYMKEVGMTVEERLKLLNDRSRIQKIGRQNKLWTVPDIVVFQNFETHVTYTTTISFMHQKQHPVRIKVKPNLNACFRLKELPGTVYSKLAPGTPHKMILEFYSEEYRDYSCVISFEADEDSVELPIVAYAPRPIIILPDEIEMSKTVVNISSDRKVFMRNMGKTSVVFKLRAEAPFSVCPRTGIIEPNEVLDVKVSYKTFRVETNVSKLIISFEGVELYSTLKCEATYCEIYLDKTVLHFEDTFLNLQRCISLNLVNNSDYTMKYQWKQFKTKYDDIKRCNNFREKLEDMKEFELLRNIQEENPNITDAELHKIFLERMYQDELREFDSTDQLLYHDKNFRFPEKSGLIGPRSIVNIEVVFCPDEAEEYMSIAYLDVTGRETRQPLKLVGNGLGPEVVLNFKVLDVNNIYLCAKHQYEIIAKNEGNIPATLRYSQKTMSFGGKMSCNPDEIFLNPKKCEKMVLEFSSTVQGKFLENLCFEILESGEHINCVFKGSVICPLLSYNIGKIDFGVVAFGFAVEREISIENKTEVPIDFRICVLNDGSHEAITWENFSISHDIYSVSSTPKEFNMYPNESTVAAYSTVSIKVTLVPNKVRKCSTFLRTYMWESQKHFVELPIYYTCAAPIIESSPTRLDIRYCFINCPYDRMFTIKNTSEVPGYIVYMGEDDDGLSCELSLTETFIKPGEEMNIHLQIKGLVLGLRTKLLNFVVFGSDPAEFCKLTCDVQGPVICVNPEVIKFGCVPLLKRHSRTLNVMNDSPVSATISINVENPIFQVQPTEFKLDASERLAVEISIYLTNVGKYATTLILNIVNCLDPLRVHVSALGEGSCILFDPILEPKYNLGSLMTHNIFRTSFNMTNLGRELQKFYFSIGKDMLNSTDETLSTKRYPFIIEPSQFEIYPKDQKSGYIEAFHTTPGPCEFVYDCFFVNKRKIVTKMFDVKITADFEDPVLALSKPFLHFRMDVTVDGTESHLEELFSVTNESFLALDIYIILNSPFYLIDENGFKTFTLNTNIASKCAFSFIVGFVPPSGLKKCSVSTDSMKIGFRLHPKVFTVPLIGDVHYPTLLVYPEAIQRQHIALRANCSKTLIIKNISPLPVAFLYEWDATSYAIEKLQAPKKNVSLEEYSYKWRLDERNDLKLQFSPEDDVKNSLIQDLVAEDEGNKKYPSMKIINQTLLENIRFPNLPQDVMKKMLFHIKYFLLPITQNAGHEIEEFWKIIEQMPCNEVDVNEAMLNITPYQGCLRPFECILVNVSIRPPLQTSLKATVKCKILGGAEEKIDFSAVCDSIAYAIDKRKVFFGYQLFSQTLEEQIHLSNTGNVDFEYAVLDDSCVGDQRVIKDIQIVGSLNVTPRMGTLNPNKSVSLNVKYNAGVIGKFTDSFVIEVDYLGSSSVDLSGIGVYPQIYLMLPRPSLSEVAETYQCYIAIGSLFQDISHLQHNMKDIPQNHKLDDVTTFILESEDWFIVEHDDESIPSTIDIDMAIERTIGFEFFQSNPQIFGGWTSLRKKYYSIPNYTVPAYELSFGNVRRDFFYEQNIPIYNYGPTMTSIRLSINDRKYLFNLGISIELSCQKLRFKEFATLSVKFNPDVKGVEITQPSISETIFIEVNQGARIPIRITALVGVPSAELNLKCIDFCGVIVGNCKRKKLNLYNVGFVDVKWTCTINSSLFFVRKKEGLLTAGESEEIGVYFEPTGKGSRQGMMTFSIDGNSEALHVCLNGFGKVSSFIVKEKNIQLPPVLQYSPPMEETFFIQNTSSFPNEVFIEEYDREIAVHDRICNLYWREMNANKVYVARSLFGKIPSDIYRYIYKRFLTDRCKRSSLSESIKLPRTDVSASSESFERILDSLELTVDSSITSRKPAQDIFLDDEMEEEQAGVGREAKIIVFHGNRYTDHLKAANDASKMLKICRSTLDGMIIDMLVRNKTQYAVDVNQIIDDAYYGRLDSGCCLCQENVIEDGTDKMWKKLNTILDLETSLNLKNTKTKDIKEKISDKASVMSEKNFRKMNKMGTFLGIPEEIIIRILSDKIDETDQMVLESLDSIFLPHAPTALKCLMKAVKNISCLHFVFFTCNLEEHTTLMREELKEREAKEMMRRQAIQKQIMELNDFSSLTIEERYSLLGIMEEKRKRNEHKRDKLRARIHESLIQNDKDQKASDLQTFWKFIDHSRSRFHTPRSSHSAFTKDTREIKTPRSKSSKKDVSLDYKPNEETVLYFIHYEKLISDMLTILEHWNKKDQEEGDYPSFESTVASIRKDSKLVSKDIVKKSAVLAKFKGVVPSSVAIDSNSKENNSDTNADIGYPVWVVSKAHMNRSIDIFQPILKLLLTTIETNCSTSSEKICEDKEVVYTILTKPEDRRFKEKSKLFELVRCEAKFVGAPVERMVDRSSTSTLNVSTKKRNKKRTLTLTPTPSDIDEITCFSARFLLEPGDIQEVTFIFKPLKIGSFKYSYQFEAVGTNHKEKVMVQASCDFPRIDTSPYTLFPHRIHNVDSRSMFLNGIYVMSQKILDLGNILLIPKSLLVMKSSICLLNASGMLCEIQVTFKGDSDVFYCDENQRNIVVKPGRQHVFTVYAKPPKEGPYNEILLFTITNNPRVQEVQLSCFACPLKFEVTPKNINFNKVILGKTEREKIVLNNNTAVVVYFEFEVDVNSEFKISTFNGYLEPYSPFDVTITFVPKTIGERKDSLILKVFDKEKQYPKPVQKEVLTLFAEAANFPLQYSTKVDLGLVKGKIAHFFPFTINNTGKYDVKILLSKTNNQELPGGFTGYFKMKHMEYVVHGETKFTNSCRFICDEEMAFEDIPIFQVMILDNYRNSTIHNFEFRASAKVALSKFELCPHGEYFFGYQNINTSRSSLLTLKNVGDFDFKYTIMTPAMVQEQALKKQNRKEVEKEEDNSFPSVKESEPTTGKKTSDKMTASTVDSRKKRKLKTKSSIMMIPHTLKAGVFIITSATGIVQPNHTVTITIESRPTESEKYKETLIFFVSEPSSEDRSGRRLNLHVEGTEPRINFHDYGFMFPMHYIVENIGDLSHLGENLVFERRKNMLHFGKIALNNSVSTKFRIPNVGHVTASIQYDIREKDGVFSVQSKLTDIPSFKAVYNVIEFAPRAIGIFTGALEMRCLGCKSGQDVNSSINLMGEGCMPTIDIMKSDDLHLGEDTLLSFGATIVKNCYEKTVVIKNTGQVACKVVIDLAGDPDWYLSLSFRRERGFEQNSRRNEKIHSDVMVLAVGEKGFISIKYEPESAGRIDAFLNFIVLDNCFDTWKVNIQAFAFDAPVCLVDLPVGEIENETISYLLNFGTVDKNELYKAHFRIKNLSDGFYRFQFEQIEELIFSPSVGHLYEGSEKTVVAAFKTNYQINFKRRNIKLTVTEIKFNPRVIFSIPWDERQNVNIAEFKSSFSDVTESQLIPSLADAVFETNEPPYDTIRDPDIISLLVNAQCGDALYNCETQKIVFPPTLTHKVNSKSISVENISDVNLEIDWKLVNLLANYDEHSLFGKMQGTNTTGYQEISRDICFFAIEPKTCIIPPERSYDFQITFSPKVYRAYYDYLLKANVKNLDPEMKDLEIKLTGYCQHVPYYFSSSYMEDFEESDLRFRTYCGLAEGEQAKILNFLSLGVGSECNRTLIIKNNMQKPFSFVWRDARFDKKTLSYFNCEFNKGLVNPGKIAKTNFIFMPQSHGEFNGFFSFEPDDPYMPRTSLLLVGVCRDPKVCFERAGISIGSTLLNNLVEREIVLRNDDGATIQFSFKKNSLISDNQERVEIYPVSGILQSMSRTKIRISVRATKQGESCFSPKCVIQYMSEPIYFNLLMSAVDVSTKLYYFDKEKECIEVQPNIPLTINLGVIIPHKMENIRFELNNTSAIGVYYSWTTEDKQLKTKIQFSSQKGFLRGSAKMSLIAKLLAIRRSMLKNIVLTLRILYGPTYIFRVEASSQHPKFLFSFLRYDFGKCLIQREQSKFYNTSLVFKNNNKWPVVLEFGQNQVTEFNIDFKSDVVDSDALRTINIYFSPIQHRVYYTAINFFVDSQKVTVKLYGEGVPLHLEVLSLNDKFLDFGRVRVGKTVQKSLKVLNASETSVDVIFHLPSRHSLDRMRKIEKEDNEFCIEPAHETTAQEEGAAETKLLKKKKGKVPVREERISIAHDEISVKTKSKEKLLKDKKKEEYSKAVIMKSLEKFTDSEMQVMISREALNKFLSETIELHPKKVVRILPDKSVDLVVKFKPTEIRKKFESNIYFQVQNYTEPLVAISGSAIDAHFSLNKDVINFGNVVVGYSNEESIMLLNEGYIGGKFKWALEKNSNYVSFIGGEGYSTPNSKMTTTIIFKPGHVQCVFKFKAYCQIENYNKRLEVILTGGSMNLPPPIDTLQFTAAVREECSQNIEFRNDTKDTWCVEPIFTGNYFSGASALRVPRESTVTYEVVYSPMKINPSLHKGSVFFPLSGINRMYALEGMVTPPNPVEKISREICCKTYHSENLRVENWLGLRQQFRVTTEVLDGSSTRMIYKITSNDHFELPPYGKREFKWTIYVVNEGKLSFKITFLNEKTGEYLYYIITLKILPLEIEIENIEFVTCVRVPTVKKILVKNPLPETAEFSVKTSSPCVIVDSAFILLPYEKYNLSVTYLPVKVETTSTVLTISNPAIGSYSYNLLLEAQAPNSEPEEHFRAHLGQSISKTIRLSGMLQNSDAAAQITGDVSFEVLKLQCQSEKPFIEVFFFPSEIGTIRSSLQITSCVGDFMYPLVGESLPPEPQGPLVMTPGESVSIEINNPFEDNMLFKCILDNNIFQVKPSEDIIKAKKTMKVSVSAASRRLSKSENLSPIHNGKLKVLCENNVEWIYYLQCQISNK